MHGGAQRNIIRHVEKRGSGGRREVGRSIIARHEVHHSKNDTWRPATLPVLSFPIVAAISFALAGGVAA